MTDRIVRVLVPGLQGPRGPSGGPIVTLLANSDILLSPGDDLWVDTSEGQVTARLPLLPEEGNAVTITRDGPHEVVIDPQGQTIQNFASNYILSTDREGVTMRFLAGTWKADAKAPPRMTGQPVGLLLLLTRAI